MANELEKTLESLPSWFLPAAIGGVVLVAMFSRSGKGSASPHYNTVVYGPQPSDPGLIGLATSEVNARTSVVQTLINGIMSRDISGIQSDRDIAIAHVNESVANARTQAAEAVGLADADSRTQIALQNARTAQYITDSQGATTKYVARKQNNPWNHAIDQAGNIIKGIGSLFGK